ncbi:hypothetical protein H1R82_14370 [Thermoactinomyces intermedius]|nr:hypothetical protein [Thermoactinomyces intermedius]
MSLALSLLFVGNAFAWDKIYSDQWSGRTSPTYGPWKGSVFSYHDLGSTDIVKVQVENVSYNSSNIESIRGNYYSHNYRHGLDITDVGTGGKNGAPPMSYNGFWYTNYPEPYFDVDNDDGVYGNEETEVVCQKVLDIKTGVAYDFYVEFYNSINPTNVAGYFEINSHESEYWPIVGEYQTRHYSKPPLQDAYYNTH